MKVRLLPRLTTLLLLANQAVAASDLADFAAGDVAPRDIVTPVPLQVVNPAETARLREAAARRVPLHFLYRTNVVADAEAALASDFALTRSNYLQALEAALHPPPLDTNELDSPSFREFVPRFALTNTGFPITPELARAWASGDPGSGFERPALERLRRILGNPIYDPGALPPGMRVEDHALLIPCGSELTTASPQLVRAAGLPVSAPDFQTIAQAIDAARHSFPDAGSLMSDYMTGWVRPNCVLDVALTRSARDAATEGIVAMDNYAIGQVIVHRGERITEAAKAALNQLQEGVDMGRLQQDLRWREEDRDRDRIRHWLIVGGTLLALVAMATALQWLRQRVRRGAPEAAAAGSVIAAPPAVSAPANSSQSRQEQGAQAGEQGDRVRMLQARMQERFNAYEQQIADLQKQLDAGTALQPDQVRTELERLRRQLQMERARSEAEWKDE